MDVHANEQPQKRRDDFPIDTPGALVEKEEFRQTHFQFTSLTMNVNTGMDENASRMKFFLTSHSSYLMKEDYFFTPEEKEAMTGKPQNLGKGEQLRGATA
jgi:hypothetical protein